MAQSAERLHVRVGNASSMQRLGQRFAVELWIVPGARDGPHVNQMFDTVGLKKFEERLDGPSGVPYGQDHENEASRAGLNSRCQW
jgi:hypothetical protein